MKCFMAQNASYTISISGSFSKTMNCSRRAKNISLKDRFKKFKFSTHKLFQAHDLV